MLANAPATSSSQAVSESKSKGFRLPGDKNKNQQPITDEKALKSAKQGVLNLLALLQARYTAPEEKLQLAILFSLITDPQIQPSKAIRSIIGEADNASISEIEVSGLLNVDKGDSFRDSSRHGGGYGPDEVPEVLVDAPPGLGSDFKSAKLSVTMKPTSRVLRIRVIDGGEGYTTAPKVDVIQKGATAPCEACAILDRNGSVESVLVLDPGFGFGKGDSTMNKGIPEVVIAPPKKAKGSRSVSQGDESRYLQAYAVAELEYAIESVNIVNGGNGYILNEPPKLVIQPPKEDADWYISPIDKYTMRAVDTGEIGVTIKSMTSQNISGNIIDVAHFQESLTWLSNPRILDALCKDPITLFPESLRPQFTPPKGIIPDTGKRAGKNGYYRILSLPDPPAATMILPSPRYRAYDPCFGAIGSKPVTMSAKALTGDEYIRLALSGAICTVIVRTALNPLELVKTKIQLQNDVELMQAISDQKLPAKKEVSTEKLSSIGKDAKEETNAKENADVGTLDVIKAMISLRGPLSLFQSADIVFLASVVFGTFGFGATELFRRSFTVVFFPESSGGFSLGSEFTLLAAAGLACVLTSYAAAPFEILRVRSMAYAEPKQIGTVFSDFLVSFF